MSQWDEEDAQAEAEAESDEEFSPRPRRASRGSQRSKESGGSAARRRFSAEGRSHSVFSVGSGFSSMSVFDRIELPAEKRPWRELLMPLGILLLFLAVVLGTALLTNSVKSIVFTEGAFGYATQVSDAETAQWVRWQRALRMAEPTLGQRLPGAADVVQVSWRRLVLLYQLPGGDTASSLGLQRAKEVEDTLRGLPMWQRLCGEMPLSYQALCTQGDSVASASHGRFGQVSSEEAAAGLEANILLDGGGSEELIDLETLTQIFKERSPATLRRWLPQDQQGAQAKAAFRSSFTFVLNPASAESLWRALVIDEVEPALVQLGVMSAAREEQDDFRVYLEADGLPELDPNDLKRSMDEDLPLLVFGPLSAFLAALAMRGRVFVAMVAGVLALAVPLLTSIGFLAQRTQEGLTEVRIIAAAAWFLISAGMADLCSACTHALEERKESLRPMVPEWLMVRMLATVPSAWLLAEAAGHRALALKLSRVFCEALLPTLVVGLMLLLVAPELELARDFAQHAGLGLLVGVPLAALLIPPAIEAGDALSARLLAWRNETDFELPEAVQLFFDNLFPMEFGARQDWQNELKFKMRKRMRDFLRLRWVSWAVMVVLLGFLLTYAVFATQSAAVYTAETPKLFEVGHRLHDKASVSSLFDPLEDYQAPMRSTLLTARRCAPTATDEQCTWFKCEAGAAQEEEATSCKCYEVQGPSGSGRCEGAAARLFGAQATAAENIFWSWASARMNRAFSNASAGAPESFLEIEIWSTGGRSLNLGRASTAQAASWDAACVRILCFCGGMECRTQSDWSYIGELELGAVSDPSAPEAVGNESLATPGPGPGPEEETVNITFAWGLEVSSEPLSELETGLSFTQGLVLEDLDAQRELLAFCEGTPPELEILHLNCWPLQFKQWLHQRGAYYPVASDAFYGSLRQFFQEKEKEPNFLLQKDLSGFWLTGEGTAQGLYFTFQVAPQPEGLQALRSAWQSYAALRARRARAWLAPSSEVVARGEVATAAVMQQNAMWVALFSMLFPALIVLLVTWSWGLALTSLILVAVAMMLLEFLHTRVNNQEVGVLEIVGLMAYNASIVLGLLRVSVHIAWSQDGPGRDPGRRHRKYMQAQKIGRLSVLLGMCQEAQEADGSKFFMRSMSKGFTVKTLEDLSFGQRKVLLSQMASLNSPALFEGGLRHERLGRSARAACRAGTEAMAVLLCLAISCTSVLFTSLEGISQVCVVCLAGGAMTLFLTCGVHPVLMLLGLGPAKVKGRAWAIYVWWLMANCPRPSDATPEGLLDTDLGSLGRSAAKVLGLPFIGSRSSQQQPSEEPEDEVTVQHLQIHGATSMPPFHGATVTHGHFSGKG